eukprot:1155503-Pelagomonas_calceolata.AAC.6
MWGEARVLQRSDVEGGIVEKQKQGRAKNACDLAVLRGGVARNAEKLAKPVLPDTEVALICSARDNRAFLQQTMPCSRIHACIAECTPCKLLLPFIAYIS